MKQRARQNLSRRESFAGVIRGLAGSKTSAQDTIMGVLADQRIWAFGSSGLFVVTFGAPSSRPIGLGSLLFETVQPATSIEAIPAQPPERHSRAPQFRLRNEF